MVTSSRKLKIDRQYNGRKKWDKYDQQSTTQKTEDGATGTVLKSRVAQE